MEHGVGEPSLAAPLVEVQPTLWYSRPFAEWYAGETKFRDCPCVPRGGDHGSESCCSALLRFLGFLPCFRLVVFILLFVLFIEGMLFLPELCNSVTFVLVLASVVVACFYSFYAVIADDEDGMFPPTWSYAKRGRTSSFWCMFYVFYHTTVFAIVTVTVVGALLANVVPLEDLFDFYCLEDKRFPK